MRSIIIFFAAAIILFAGVCSAGNVKLDKKDSSRTLSLKKGDTVEISLPGNPTTGYSWEAGSFDRKCVKLAGTKFKRDSNLIGAGGVFDFKFRMLARGQSKILIVYRRPWEKDVAPADKFELSVSVK